MILNYLCGFELCNIKKKNDKCVYSLIMTREAII